MTHHIYLPELGIINALGNGIDEVSNGLFSGDVSGLLLEDGWLPENAGGSVRVGRARGSLPAIPDQLTKYNCRNNRLLLAAIAQIENSVETALVRYGKKRIGVVIGSSTSGIAEGEAAFATNRAKGTLPFGYHYTQQEIGMPAVFLAKYLGISGPAYTVCNACTSSAKAFVSARNLLRRGICDLVLVGGVDSLCRLTINGFSALQSISQELSNPMSRNRRGINIGEGAALFIMSRDESAIKFLGVGETSDAYHMSAPHPEGLGAEAAMRAALLDARMDATEIGYVNLHATATQKNDAMESRAMARVFAEGAPSSGTKPLTGHLLGAAGATELAFCWLAISEGRMPPHIWDGDADPDMPQLDLIGTGHRFSRSTATVCMSNSFAFGGSNVSLLIGE